MIPDPRRRGSSPQTWCRPAGPKGAGRRCRGRLGAWAVLLALAWLWGCTLRPPLAAPLLDSRQSDLWRARLEAINRDLGAVKAVGRLALADPRGSYGIRAAWAAAPPDRLRMDLLGGVLPAASLASDGRRISLRENDSGRVRTLSGADASLAPLLGLALTVPDAVRILAGRPPVLPGDALRAQDLETDGETALFFEKRRGGYARVVVAGGGRELRQVEMRAGDGTLRWRVVYRDYRDLPPYRLPAVIEISDETRSCTLRAERIWPDAILEDRLFILHGPDGGS